MLPLHDHAGLDGSEHARLSQTYARLRTLEEVLRLFALQKPPPRLVDIVTQDEYTHDVIYELRPGRYLVFDTT
jgi:hypothetical protein